MLSPCFPPDVLHRVHHARYFLLIFYHLVAPFLPFLSDGKVSPNFSLPRVSQVLMAYTLALCPTLPEGAFPEGVAAILQRASRTLLYCLDFDVLPRRDRAATPRAELDLHGRPPTPHSALPFAVGLRDCRSRVFCIVGRTARTDPQADTEGRLTPYFLVLAPDHLASREES